MMHRLRMKTTMLGSVLLLYVLCMEANLELTKRFRKRTLKKLKTRIKEKKGGRNIGQRFFRAASLNFIAIDLLKVARMNTARIWICRQRRWRCRLPDVVGTKPLVVICYPAR